MSSINTNPSAMTALQVLHVTNKALGVVQSRISTGMRVAQASDNAAYWSIATTMRSDNRVLSTVQDTLGLGASRVDTAYTALESAIAIVDEIKQKVLAAVGMSEDNKERIQAEISAYQEQLRFTAMAATFSGANWLSVNSLATNGHPADGTHKEEQIVSAFTRNQDGAIILGYIEIDVQSIKLYDAAATTNETMGLLEGLRLGTTGQRDNTAVAGTPGTLAATDGYAVASLNVVGHSDEQLEQMLAVVDATLAEMADAATTVGAIKKRVDMQKDYTSSLMDSIDRGVGQLVDADMNRESTRLQALQVQQQLGIQSLQIANSYAENILLLFRN
ncbi:flagellin [Mesorhizobium microcysteis]|uniref:Flagellin n=1 Tax=Neoaquamicrobium microcysteis TaxID=2682781 RepID=A0A5D4GMN6_9HYPH|nr:flagellin [Mesorhizobium microcysteis]